LTIEGRWQKWSGPVGCGRRASSQEIWYLAASRVVSPNPIVKSDSGDEVIVLLPSPTSFEIDETPVSQPTPNQLPTPPIDDIPTLQPDSSRTPTPSPTFQLIPTAEPGASATATPEPTTTTASGDSDPTGTATPTITATATATTSGSTPSATTAPADQGTIAFDTVEKKALAANSAHTWRFSPLADEPIIITAGSSLNLNLKLDLIGPNGVVVASANQAGAGRPETISYTTPNPTGNFQIVVSGDGGTSGLYVLMLFDSESEPVVVIQNTLVYGSGGSGNIPAGVDHFWNFEGQAGDTISIEVSPTSTNGDLIFYLIGPDGSEMEFIDENGIGDGESLIDYILPESGFYSIGIGELDFGLVDYSMTLIQ
jgi:hypothetical protein